MTACKSLLRQRSLARSAAAFCLYLTVFRCPLIADRRVDHVLQLGPRLGGAFLVDEQLRQEVA